MSDHFKIDYQEKLLSYVKNEGFNENQLALMKSYIKNIKLDVENKMLIKERRRFS